MTKRKTVGIYQLGTHNIRLVLKEGTGGNFDIVPDKPKRDIAEMSIGVDSKFKYSVETLIHEVWEAAMVQSRLRYDKTDDLSWSADRYYFIFNHQDLSHMSVIAGDFIESCYLDFRKAWSKFKRGLRITK